MSEAELVSAYWGKERTYGRPAHWLDHPVTRALINTRISGDATVGAAEWLVRRIGTGPRRALSLGCGFGGFESCCVTLGLAGRVEAVDISVEAIAHARATAAAAQLTEHVDYRVADLNEIALPSSAYDLIAGVSAVHHVEQLERLFIECSQALKPGGWLFLDEYVGPSRFQSTPAVLAEINTVLASLPERYRRSAFSGHIVDNIAPPPLAWFAANDPSEAARSADILPVLAEHFEIVELRPYGGAILHLLLSGIAGNFDETDPHDVELLEKLEATERRLEESGVIGSDFAAVLARRRV
jgi:2-polyprenyl-3-methyl-5-hydroxy-6-metoxy-1,4-benzoquinol methylase